MSTRTVTKHDFLTALGCKTRAWYGMRESGGAPTPADLLRMLEGQEVHRRAQTLHPNGVFAGSIEKTKRLILDRAVDVVFEAAFTVDGYTARADWIRRVKGGWVIGEIKSSLFSEDGSKDEYLEDLAYTVMVARRSGLPVKGCELVLMNRNWRLGMPDADLFFVTDHTPEVMPIVDEFNRLWDQIAPLLLRRSKPSPHWCWECRDCECFADRCVGVGNSDPIFQLPRLSEKKFTELTAMGVTRISSIPSDFKLSDSQQRTATAIRTRSPQIDAAEIRSALDSLEWPIGYLDFETLMTAVPLYPDVAPHEQLVTQYSLHVEASPGGELAHREYLADHARDCREELAARLIRDTAGCGTVVVYSSFEKTMIRWLAKLLPTYASELDGLEAKLFDLEPVVRKGLVHPEFGGRSSIKVVLPVLAPDLSYTNLDIGDGGSAVAAFARLASGDATDDEIQAVRDALLEYCKLDTLAMVRVLRAMRTLI
jgi:predicted RecB family nuclease